MMNNKQVNEHVLLIYGKSNLIGEPEVQENGDVTITVHGNLQKVETVDNNDGTVDVVYKVKQISAEVC